MNRSPSPAQWVAVVDVAVAGKRTSPSYISGGQLVAVFFAACNFALTYKMLWLHFDSTLCKNLMECGDLNHRFGIARSAGAEMH